MFFLLVYDVETELLAAHMPSDVCASGNFNVFEVQQVQTPSDVVPLVSQARSSEAQVAVYQAGSPASFHARWTGTIQGLDGRDYRLTEVYHLNADAHDPNNPDTFEQTVARVELRPER